MTGIMRRIGADDLFVSDLSSFLQKPFQTLRSPEVAEILWWFFAGSVVLSVLPRYVGEPGAPFSLLFAIGGAGPCAWAWLFTRALFRERQPFKSWTLVAAGAVIAIEAAWHFIADYAAASELRRVAGNAASLICIGALVLALIEPIASYSAQSAAAERRFRKIFIGVFCAVVLVTLVWAANAAGTGAAAKWADAVVAASVATAVIGSRAALNFRKRRPFAPEAGPAAPKSPPAAARDEALAARIRRAVDAEAFFSAPDRRLADLASLLGEPEYKVSQCITGALGSRNFNHLVNSRRIDRAKALLADPQQAGRPILSIAFDCGFNSIGPFNRAFKHQLGVTPREFRSASHASNR